jgi:hypothetical protein
MCHLVAAANPAGERRQPDRDASADVAGHAKPVTDPERRAQNAETDQHQTHASGRDGIHRHEEAGHDQRRPQVRLRHIEQERGRQAEEQRQQVVEVRHMEPGHQAGASDVGIAERPEVFPPASEIRGEKLDFEQSNDFDGLTAPEIHFRATSTGPAAQYHQRYRQEQRRGQRHVGKGPQTVVADRHQDAGDAASEEHAGPERPHEQKVAKRVAERNHRHHAEAAERQRGWKEQSIATMAAVTPHHVQGVETHQQQRHRAGDLTTKRRRCAEHR